MIILLAAGASRPLYIIKTNLFTAGANSPNSGTFRREQAPALPYKTDIPLTGESPPPYHKNLFTDLNF